MGKSAKFYKKPTLKEKQSLSKPSGSSSTGASSSTFRQRSSASIHDPAKKVAAVAASASKEGGSKAQRIAQKVKERQKAEEAAKPKFNQLVGATRAESGGDDEDQDMEDDEDGEEDDEGLVKRRPRNRNKKDWGPMPKEMGIDYVKLWDNRSQ